MKKFLLIVVLFLLVFAKGNTSSIAETTYTNDKIQGRPVITELDVNDLKAGRNHEFYFQTVENNLGQYWYVPVTVIKGSKPGTRVMLIAAVHGNELNGIPAVARIKEIVDPKQLSGTITIVHAINIPGTLANVRHYQYSGVPSAEHHSWPDLNRLWNKGLTESSAQNYSTTIWNKLLKSNADYAIDLHTHSAGLIYSMYILANVNVPGVVSMVKTMDADTILLRDGIPGTVDASYLAIGVPAVTVEMGAAEQHQEKEVSRMVDSMLNFFRSMKMLPGKVKEYQDVLITNEIHWVAAVHGGYAIVHPELNSTVKKGDLVATQYDPFGNKLRDYTTPVGGKVIDVAHNPFNEDVYWSLVGIYYYNPDHKTQIWKD